MFVDKSKVFNVGGDLENAVKGEYTIDVSAVLKEGWKKTQQSRKAINSGLLFVFSLGVLISYLISEYFGGIEKAMQEPQTLLLIQTLVSLVIWPFLAGVEMMGVFHAVGLKTETNLIFSFLKRASMVVLCGLFTSLLVSVGFQLLVLPGIFLAVIFSLTIPLVVEKRLSPIKAMVISVQALRFQWLKLFLVYLALTGIFALSILPLVLLGNSNLVIIGIVLFFFVLSYLAPLFYNVKGILYREIFGLKLQTTDQSSSTKADDVFIA